jgi:hypothetical protein
MRSGNRTWTVIAVACLLVLAGCSVRYKTRIPGFQPGYVDERLGEDTYQVRIGEAWPKDWPNLRKFALYRAADITASRGNRYFIVGSASTQITQYAIPQPTTTHTSGSATIVGNSIYGNATSVTSGGGTITIQGGWYYLDFTIIDERDIAAHESVFDSSAVMEELKYFIDARR